MAERPHIQVMQGERLPSKQITTPNGKVIGEFFPNTLVPVSGSELQSRRLAGALDHAVSIHTHDPKTIAKRDKLIERMDTFAAMKAPNIRLTDFAAEKDRIERVIDSNLLSADTPQFIELAIAALDPDTSRDFWHAKDGEGAKMIAEFDEVAYGAIKDNFGLADTYAAKDFFREHVREANRVIESFPLAVFPDSSSDLELINEASMLSSPGYMVFLALSPHLVDKQLQFETTRTLSVAELLAQSDRQAKDVSPLVEELQKALGDEVFDHGQRIGQTERKSVYAFFNKDTGEHLWNSQTGSKLTQEELEKYQRTAMLKLFNWRVRDSEDAGPVKTKPRMKGDDSIFDKIAREALRREEYIGDDYMDPSSVTDLGGIKQVVLNAKSLNSPEMDVFINKHREVAIKRFGPDTEVVERNETNGDRGGSEERNFRRVDITVHQEGRRFQLEVIFETIESYLNAEQKYGAVDPETGIRKALAHPLYGIIRKIDAAKLLYPETYYDEIDWNLLAATACEEEVRKLSSRNRVPISALPREYIQGSDTEIPASQTGGVVYDSNSTN